MSDLRRNLSSVLGAGDRRQLLLILACMVVIGGIEVLGVGSILPFLAVVADPGLIQSNRTLARIHQALGLQSDRELIVLIGATSFVLVTAGNLLNAFAGWLLTRFALVRSHRLATALMEDHLRRAYAERIDRNTSDVVSELFIDVRKFTYGVLMPALNVVSRIVVALAIFALVVAVNPVIALSATVVVGMVYLVLYRTLRSSLFETGKKSEEGDSARMRIAFEALSAIKEVKVFGVASFFSRRFSRISENLGRIESNLYLMAHAPRYGIEAITFGGIVAVALYLTRDPAAMAKAVPTIALFAFAAYRLLPSVQQIFAGISTIRFHLHSLAILAPEMRKIQDRQRAAQERPGAAVDALWSEIRVIDASVAYPDRPAPALDRVSIAVRRNEAVGVVGATGSGKSTLIDLLVGLIDPTGGELRVGAQAMASIRSDWFRHIGYVPQNPVLLDATIAENIAFGVEPEDLDMENVIRAARLAQIDRFIEDELPGQYLTPVGERGVRLSGGQRQRLALARALYRRPQVIILDEATSAVDSDTERQIVDTVRELAREATVIAVTHSISAVREFDRLIVLEGGRKVAEGTYDDLLANNEKFRAIAGA